MAGTTLGLVRAAIVDAWRHAGPGHVGMAREFVRTMPSTDPHTAHYELLASAGQAIVSAVTRGELSGDLPTDLAAVLALAQMIAPMNYPVKGQEINIDALWRLLLNQWLKGMARIDD